MNHATPRMRDFAMCLIAYEEDVEKSSQIENRAALRVVQKLQAPLEELMGTTSYRALLMNALARAKGEVPWLGEARMNQDGSFNDFEQTSALTGPGKSSQGGAVMLAWFLGLLGSFIGELLTVQLLLEVWPDLSRKGCFPLEHGHEKDN